MRYKKIAFEEAVKEFNFNQFYEVCKIFGVDIVDRVEFDKLMEEAKENGTDLDVSRVKMRRDFDKMTEELIEVYNSFPRRNRRQIDPIVAKIVWGNKRARNIVNDNLVNTYNAAVAQLPEINSAIEQSTDMAAEVSEGDC